MRRVLFAAVVLVMLLSSFSSAFAAEPQRVEQGIPALLGQVWWFYFDFGLPFIQVDAYLYRPSTLGGWPWQNSGGLWQPEYGTWWKTEDESGQRRQSWPSYQMTDQWGYYYAEFMLPRDEVWYPCGYPLQWKCNYQSTIPPYDITWHSPVQMDYEPGLYWPWLQLSALADPQDTASPLEVYLIDEYGWGYIIPFEVLGMTWKWSDFD